MGTWHVKSNGDPDDPPLFSITVELDKTITLHIPSPDPVNVTARKVEEIRFALGAAAAEASQAGLSQQDDHGEHRGSPEGEDRD